MLLLCFQQSGLAGIEISNDMKQFPMQHNELERLKQLD